MGSYGMRELILTDEARHECNRGITLQILRVELELRKGDA
jgi:hypothetical protein